ncbi:MAG: hypothetical protein HOK48_05465 [Actinobacteria bacterium]|nr:hypothetical protein [Actinomycetota bacterium]MBT5501608.1 hypothetical protein [Actinomycetota bacterium]
MKEDHMLDEMNTSNKFNFFGVDLPKIDLPKIDLPTFNIPAIHMDGVNSAIGAVKSAANDGYTTATEAATKVRNSAGHTITLVREAIGV